MSRDCKRLGLRCVDCLPRNLWCSLCLEKERKDLALHEDLVARIRKGMGR